MTPEELIGLMNELPDDMIDSANRTRFRRRGSIWYLIPAAAACLLVGIAAMLYPKLQTQKPAAVGPAETGISVSAETTGSETSAADSTSAPVSGTQQTETAVSDEPSHRTGTQSDTRPSSGTQHTTASVSSMTTDSTVHCTEATPQSTQDTKITSLTSQSTSQSTASSANETESKTDASDEGMTFTEEPVPFRILSQKTVEASEESLPFSTQIKLYRDALPDAYSAELFPAIDFETEDCLVIRFRAEGCGDGIAEPSGGSGMFYSITVTPPAAPEGTVQEFAIAAVVPKALYSPAAPDGLNRWLRLERTVRAGAEMQCTMIRYE
ncbi:MAG: hypothetical protein K6E36_02690 [Oscillospiraceae bacterium]|nr:hypothetical protein [Oscillospiraceae bacterium]